MEADPCLSDLFNQLLGLEPEEPNGWFRWMHHGFFGRYGLSHGEVSPAGELWEQMGSALSGSDLSDDRQLGAWMPLVERHAWTFGQHMAPEVVRRLIAKLTPEVQGLVLAGASERLDRWGLDDDALGRVALEITGMWDAAGTPVLSGIAAAELACNAIGARQHELLHRVLASAPTWGQEAVLRLEPHGEETAERWSIHSAPLSSRAVDRCLEAALRMGNAEAVALCLAAGADPNIGVWCLERSYNQRYCALSYAIAHTEDPALPLIHALIDGGADASGTDYDGRNTPLFMAVSRGDFALANLLLDGGASFTGGHNERLRPDPGARFQSPSNPDYGYRAEDLRWAEREIGSLIPLRDILAVPAFYCGDGQGGSYGRFLPVCLKTFSTEQFEHFISRGLPLDVTPHDVVDLTDVWAPFERVDFLLKRLQAPGKVLFRMRRRCPELGTGGAQYMCRPEPNGSNVLKEFDAHGQTPLRLPDGSKYYVYLDGIASPGHGLGGVLAGHVMALSVKANYRRRLGYTITRGLRFQWEMVSIQPRRHGTFQDSGSLLELLPVIKEVDGVRSWTGLTLRQLSSQNWPSEWEEVVDAWINGAAGKEVIALAKARIDAQDASNPRPPVPVLTPVELEAYPRLYWPCLRRLENGLIDVTDESCHYDPPIMAHYRRWAAENKPDLDTFVPDPRLMQWPLWDSIPRELQPFFHFHDALGIPSSRHDCRNEYERVMMRKAGEWKNAQFLEAARNAAAEANENRNS